MINSLYSSLESHFLNGNSGTVTVPSVSWEEKSEVDSSEIRNIIFIYCYVRDRQTRVDCSVLFGMIPHLKGWVATLRLEGPSWKPRWGPLFSVGRLHKGRVEEPDGSLGSAPRWRALGAAHNCYEAGTLGFCSGARQQHVLGFSFCQSHPAAAPSAAPKTNCAFTTCFFRSSDWCCLVHHGCTLLLSDAFSSKQNGTFVMSQNEVKDSACCFPSRSAPWRAPHLAMIDVDWLADFERPSMNNGNLLAI